jgi:hypothetical protein
MQLEQGDRAKVGLDAPSACVAAIRRNDASITQVPHRSPYDDWIGA